MRDAHMPHVDAQVRIPAHLFLCAGADRYRRLGAKGARDATSTLRSVARRVPDSGDKLLYHYDAWFRF